MSSPSPSHERPSNERRLSTRLFITFLGLVLLPIVALIVIPNVVHLTGERQSITDQLNGAADIEANALDKWVGTTQSRLREIMNDPLIRPAVNEMTTGSSASAAATGATFTQRAQAIIQAGGPFDRLILLDAQGLALTSSDPDLTLTHPDFSGETWWQVALRQPGEVVLSGPLRDPLDGVNSLYFSITVRTSGASAPVGVFSGRVPVETLSNVLVALPFLGQTGDVFLVREGRQYVTMPRSAPSEAVASDQIISAALRRENGSGTWTNYQGNEVFGVYRWIEPLQMSLIVSQGTGEALGASRETLQLQILIGIAVALLAIGAAAFFSRRIVAPLESLSNTALRVSHGDLALQAPMSDALEFNQLAVAFNRMTGQVRTLLEKQEQTIGERTRQLEITAQIGRVLAAETDLDRLLKITINMIREQLNYYHAQIFMLDDLHQYAVLRASTGPVGQELLARGHKLAVGSQSVIGQVTSRGEPILARDTDISTIHQRNELLPDTRAELAIPLRIGDQIVGALDVQSTRPEVFDEATIAAFHTIADQLAVAIRNAQLFQEKEGLLAASLQLTQTLTRDNWNAYLGWRKQPSDSLGFQYDLSDVRPLDGNAEDEGNGRQTNLPIALRGEIIGDLAARLPEDRDLTDDEKQLVGQVLDRVALALDNARLFEQTQISLMETERLYQASQQIAAADSVTGLVDDLLGLMRLESVGRAAILLHSQAGDEPGSHWIDIKGRWARNPDDSLMTLPERLPMAEFPLLAEFKPDKMGGGLLIHDVDSAELDEVAKTVLRGYGVKALAYFPIITGGRTLGWLMMHSLTEPHAFTDTDKRFFEAITDHAATALEGLRLYEDAQARVRRLQAVNEVSRAASSILDPEILLPLTVEKIGEAFGYYHTQIFLVDELGEWAVLRASTGEVGQELLHREHKLAVGSQSVIGQVTARGEPVIARDTDTDALHKRNELLPDTRAEMAIPLKTGDRVVGALDVQSTLVNAFDAEAQVILQSLADQISVTLENAQLFREIQDRVAELTTVNLISQAVSRAETLADLYEVVATQLQRTFGAKHALLAVLTESDMIEVPILLEGGQLMPPIAPIPLGQGLTGYVIKTRETLIINHDLEQEAQRLGAKVIGVMPKSLLAVPLLLGEEVVGVISIQDAEKENAYNETHVRQLTTLAAYIAIKIRNAELLDEAQRRAAELGFLFNVTRSAVATSEMDEALGNVANILLGEIKGAEAAMIYLSEPGGEMLGAHAAAGYGRDLAARHDQVQVGSGMIGAVAQEGAPLIVGDAQENPRYADFDQRTHAAVVVPLKAGQEMIGVLLTASTQPAVFSDRELRLLEAASGTLTAIIQNARLLEQITRANEQLRELDKLKSQFLANMSHELRTPLNSIIGFSRVMLKGIDGSLNDLQSQDLTTIYQSGQHLLGLINDILDLSKIEAGKMEIQPDYVGLEEIIDGVMATGKGLIKDRSIQIFKEVEANLPQVFGDPVRVRQVLLNLVSNAAKFTHEGAITIRASHKLPDPETGEPERVQIDVLDTGIGIAPEDMHKLFEAFSQVDGSTTRQAGGTGLGLAISKQFIELHGGRMWAESQKGVGSTFSFTVPLNPVVIETSEVLVMPENGEGRPVVLAVDDEPGVLDLYSRYLEKQGYAVVGLNNASDLIQRVREFQPAAIVLDLNLPGKDGWAAIDEIKKADDTRHVPIVICSIDDARERANHLGVTEYLVKPVIEEDLVESLNRVVSHAVGKTFDVLIIDGNEQYARTIQETLLATQRYNARFVGVGREGLQTIYEQKPDLVILDLDLPDMDGYGLLAALRSQPATRHLPILILTARELSGEALDRLDEAATAYLSKREATQEQVLAGLATVLESSQKAG